MNDLFIQTMRLDSKIETDFGIIEGYATKIVDQEVLIIPRHEKQKRVIPSDINYHGIIQAMKIARVDKIISLNSVGIINEFSIGTEETYPPLTVGSMALICDFIDFTKHRFSSYEDGKHVDMSNPFDEKLKLKIRKMCSKDVGGKYINMCGDVVYICTEGPRFETKAEIAVFREWGAHVVGMTLCPEVALAKELKIPYASIAICTNYAAGVQDRISFDEVSAEISKVKYQLDVLLQRIITNNPKISSED